MMQYQRLWSLAAFTVILGILFWPGCASPSGGHKVLISYGTFDRLPRTAEEARTAGWVELTDVAVDLELGSAGCVPNHGRHFVLVRAQSDAEGHQDVTWAGKPIDPITLLMNKEGTLVGIELASLGDQASPPWENSPHGHPDMPYKHWHLHIYFEDPATVC